MKIILEMIIISSVFFSVPLICQCIVLVLSFIHEADNSDQRLGLIMQDSIHTVIIGVNFY